MLELVDEPTLPGCHIQCVAIGVLQMTDEHGSDAKILAVPAGDLRTEWRELNDVPEHMRQEIWHFERRL